MKCKTLACGVMVVGLFFIAVGSAIAGPPDSGKPDKAAMMAMWTEMAAPVEQHKQFEKMVGVWDAEAKFWMNPAAPPQTSTGVSNFKTILGGRYLVHEYDGTAFDAPFKGMGITAYDKFRQEYIDVWFDDMSTGMMISRGTADKSGKVITYHGTMDDPMSGTKDMPVRTVITAVDDDTQKMQMYYVNPDGEDFMNMEIVYTRRK